MQYLLFNVALNNAEGVDHIPIDSRAVEEAFVPLKRETARIGLTVNYVKTKYMIAGRDKARPSGFSTNLCGLALFGDIRKSSIIRVTRFGLLLFSPLQTPSGFSAEVVIDGVCWKLLKNLLILEQL